MKLLIITQVVDRRHPVLGFFHRWIEEFAKHWDSLTVICLQKGDYDLPANVKVLSLGKEERASRWQYLIRFFRYLWQERNNYDGVFVHMNQEYVLLAGWLWRLGGKRITLWRNHHAGNWLTGLAVIFCHQVFCTSRYSFTARYKKTKLMPVGIDADKFQPLSEERLPHSILFLGRMSPIKRPHVLLAALEILVQRGVSFGADFYGDPASSDRDYYQKLKNQATDSPLNGRAQFHLAIPNQETPAVYGHYQIFVNLSPSGMYDKTIFEAAACGALALNSNENLRGHWDERLLFKENDVTDLVSKLTTLLTLEPSEVANLSRETRAYVLTHHSLTQLAEDLRAEFARGKFMTP